MEQVSQCFYEPWFTVPCTTNKVHRTRTTATNSKDCNHLLFKQFCQKSQHLKFQSVGWKLSFTIQIYECTEKKEGKLINKLIKLYCQRAGYDSRHESFCWETIRQRKVRGRTTILNTGLEEPAFAQTLYLYQEMYQICTDI